LLKNCAGGLDLVFIRSWITPIYSSFQNNDVENVYYICVKTSFLDMRKLEKTVRSKALNKNSNI
jgi:hypothetical protein